jgi:cation diffusion facilitator family transporter
LNVEAAYLHILGDIINSVGVLIASLLIYFSDGALWYCDPICTYIFGFLVFYTTRITFSYCISMLMENTPNETDMEVLRTALKALPHVKNVHDLHVWSISDGKCAVTVHLVVAQKTKGIFNQLILDEADALLRNVFRINHFSI